jgi:hypothetical protein
VLDDRTTAKRARSWWAGYPRIVKRFKYAPLVQHQHSPLETRFHGCFCYASLILLLQRSDFYKPTGIGRVSCLSKISKSHQSGCPTWKEKTTRRQLHDNLPATHRPRLCSPGTRPRRAQHAAAAPRRPSRHASQGPALPRACAPPAATAASGDAPASLPPAATAAAAQPPSTRKVIVPSPDAWCA